MLFVDLNHVIKAVTDSGSNQDRGSRAFPIFPTSSTDPRTSLSCKQRFLINIKALEQQLRRVLGPGCFLRLVALRQKGSN